MPTLSDVSTSTTPGSFLAAAATALAYFSSDFRSGPLMVNWISAFWFPPPPIVATGRTPVRRLAVPMFGSTFARTSSMTSN